jgi:hypothetical protein
MMCVVGVAQQGGLLLGACNRYAEIPVLVLMGEQAIRDGRTQLGRHGFIVQDFTFNAVEAGRLFIDGKELHRPDAIGTDGSQQVESIFRARGIALREAPADGSTVRQ